MLDQQGRSSSSSSGSSSSSSSSSRISSSRSRSIYAIHAVRFGAFFSPSLCFCAFLSFVLCCLYIIYSLYRRHEVLSCRCVSGLQGLRSIAMINMIQYTCVASHVFYINTTIRRCATMEGLLEPSMESPAGWDSPRQSRYI